MVSATYVERDQLFAGQLAMLVGFQFQPDFCPADVHK